MKYQYSLEELYTRNMIKTPISELSKTIGEKWFLDIETLSNKSGVPLQTVQRALRGEKIATYFEKRIRKVLG